MNLPEPTMRPNVKRALYTFLVFLFILSNANALELAKYAGEFMSTGVGARALGMGGAYSAMSGDVTHGYWNPAALSDMQYPELAAMHSRRFGGVVNYDYLGFAMPFRRSETLGINVIRLAVDDIPYTTVPRPEEEVDGSNQPYAYRWVSDAEYAVFLSYANRKSAKFSYGANVKFIRKNTGDNSALGIGFDIGALWNPAGDLMLGANLQDITTTVIAWDTGTKELLAPTLKLGSAYPINLSFMKSRLWMAADLDVRFEGREFAAQANLGAMSIDPRVGAELVIRQIAALRVGRDDLGFFTAGAGIRLPRLNLDYAFLSHDDLEATHRISISLRLEEDKFLRKTSSH